MMGIKFNIKMSALRPYGAPSNKTSTPADITNQLESDRGRIIQSASVRRLQQKTQVFPLERNAAVRSRLTHSLEVQQNGRYIVKTLFKKLQGREKELGLNGLAGAVESLVEMACLMHDIGNPPFGHFGEAAINGWFNSKQFKKFKAWKTVKGESLRKLLIKDLQNFEGNAQAVRLTYSLQQMNLTHAQTAAILKYTRGAWEKREDKDPLSQLKKKPGFYWSEREAVAKMCDALEVQLGHRHPFTYIMEAADDMAYCLADIEDAVEKGILNLSQLSGLIVKTFHALGGDVDASNITSFNHSEKSLKRVVNEAIQASKTDVIDGNHQFFIKLRINLIHHLVNHAANRFIDNIETIYRGDFNQALLEDDSVAMQIVQTFKGIGYNHVFNHKEVQTLELQGHQIITGLLDIYAKVLKLSGAKMSDLLSGNSDCLYEQLLFNRIDPKIRKAYQKAVKEQGGELEFYYRCRMIQDHISAMTDHSAHDEYKTLMVAD
ncbi:dGTPase [Marinicella rhabdoformis]|uniref:dGTPase n=1 Tax=Marinicella rhabdoformis TaxID=2580566 RepID=UPI0012AEBE6A|nr:dGTPase [Marinicella rhabdoformis]